MITDDQVAALLRDAGNDGPLPRPLDPSYAVAQARRGRTRTQALSGLAVALAAVLVLTEPGRAALSAATGATTGTTTGSWFWAYLAPILLLVLLLVSALATPFALRLREDAAPRRLLAALWLVLAVLLASLFSGLGLVLVRPDLLHTSFGAQIIPLSAYFFIPVALSSGALLARRRLRPGSLRVLSGAAWLTFALVSGQAVANVVLLPMVNARPGTDSPTGLLLLAVALLATVALGALSQRGRPAGGAWRRGAATTLMVCSATVAAVFGAELLYVVGGQSSIIRASGAVWLTLAVVLMLGLALLGAWLALDAGTRRWSSVVLAVAVVPLAMQAGQQLLVSVQADPRTGVPHSAPGLLAASVLGVLAVSALMVVDRCTVDHGAPASDDPADVPEM